MTAAARAIRRMMQDSQCRSVLDGSEEEQQTDQAFAISSLVKEAVSGLSSWWGQQQLAGEHGGADEVAVPVVAALAGEEQRGISKGVHGDLLRACVWHRSEWHPMPPAQQLQIEAHVRKGDTSFTIEDGCKASARLYIDGTDPATGWVVQRSEQGRSSAMKLGNTICHPTAIFRDPNAMGSRLIEMFKQEWIGLSEGKSSLRLFDLTEAFSKLFSRNDLYVPVSADIFRKVDLDMKSSIDANKWLHYRLLQIQAPSWHAMRQINSSLRVWLHEDATVLDCLLSLFVESAMDAPCNVNDGWIAGWQMKNLAKKWLACRKAVSLDDIGMDYVQLGVKSAAHLGRLIDGSDVVEQDAQVSYYEFLTHIFGRAKVTVEIYFYDLSGGATQWWSPLLFHERWPALWHTSIHVYDKEYRYGGNIYESVPGMTPFGKPMKVEVLGETARTRDDLLYFIERQLARRFCPDTYQALTNNSNHFTDAVCMFLTNTHIPDHVLQQARVIRESRTAITFRPLLPWLKGEIGSNTNFDNSQKSLWEKVSEGDLVMYEYEDGWTCIARLKVKRADSCDLRWLDTGGVIREQQFVDRLAVQPLSARVRGLLLPARKT